MKNMVRLIGIIALVAVMVFSMSACEPVKTTDMEYSMEYYDAATAGSLTISGLNAFDGQKISSEITTDSLHLYAGEGAQNEYNPNEDVSNAHETDPATVANGQAALKVFMDKGEQSGKGGGWGSYTGNDQNVAFSFIIFDSANPLAISGGTVTVNFSDGQAGASWSSATDVWPGL